MRAELFAPGLVLVLLAAALPAPAGAQTVEDSLDQALAKTGQTAEETRSDPQAMADNASDPSWQGQQANWTQAWTCEAAEAVHPQAGELAEQALDCPEAESVQAGQEEAQQQDEEAQARAEEAEADAERATRDQVAATEAFAEATASDPEDAPEHAATFLQRTLAFAERLLAAVENLLGLGANGIELGLEALRAAGLGLAESLATAAHGVEQASRASLAAAASSADWVLDVPGEVADAGLQAADGVAESLADTTQALGDGLRAIGRTLGFQGAEPSVGEPSSGGLADVGDEGGNLGDEVPLDAVPSAGPGG